MLDQRVRSKTSLSRWLILTSVIALVVAACGSGDTQSTSTVSGEDSSASTTSATEPDVSDPIRIGVVFSLTGPAGSFGVLDRDGAVLAASVINENGGVLGREIELIIEDDQTSPDRAVTIVDRLISRENVVAIVGATTGSATLAIAPIFERQEVPLLAPVSTLTVTQQGNPWVFRTAISDLQAIQDTLRQAQRQFGDGARIALLHADDAAGQTGAEFFQEVANSADFDVEIVAIEQFGFDDTDMTPQLVSIRPLEPDGIIVQASSAAGPTVVRNARELGMNQPVIGTVGMARATTWEVGGAATENVLIPTQICPGNVKPFQEAFMEQFYAAYPDRSPDKDPTLWDVISYDAVMLIAAAIERSGEATPAGIRSGLEGIQGYEGAGGIISFGPDDRDGLGEDALCWLTVEGGEFVPFNG